VAIFPPASPAGQCLAELVEVCDARCVAGFAHCVEPRIVGLAHGLLRLLQCLARPLRLAACGWRPRRHLRVLAGTLPQL